MLRCPKCRSIIMVNELDSAVEEEDDMLTVGARIANRAEILEMKKTLQAAQQPNVKKAVDEKRTDQDVTKDANQQLPESKKSEAPTRKKELTKDTNVESAPDARAQNSKSRWRLPKSMGGTSDSRDNAKENQSNNSDVSSKGKISKSNSGLQGKYSKHKKRNADSIEAKQKRTPKKNTAQQTKKRSSLQKSVPTKSVALKSARQQPDVQHPKDLKESSSISDFNADLANSNANVDAEPTRKVIGVSHSRDLIAKSNLFAIGLFILGFWMIVPAIGSFVQYVHTAETSEIPRWSAWLVFAGFVHIIYSFYAAQIPDWTSVRVIAIVMLVVTFVSAILLAGFTLSPPGGAIARSLEVPAELTSKAEIWLLSVLAISATIGFFSGRRLVVGKRLRRNFELTITNDLRL